LRGYWDTDGLPGRIQAALEQALRTVPADQPALRADAHELFAYLRFEAGFGAEALAHAEAALAAAGTDPARRARALVRRVWVQLAAGRGEHDASPAHDRWQAWLDEALALARGCGDREVQARALHQLALLQTQVRGNWRAAETLLEESQALWLALGDRRKAYARLRNRAQCWLHTGRDAEAMASYEECERAAREDGDWVGRIDTLISMSALLARQRRWSEALDANRRCVQLCWQRWHRHGLAYALWNPPRLLARLHQPEAAMRLMGFAATFWTERFGPLGKSDLIYLRRVRGLVRAQLGAARAEALFTEGAAMDVAAAVALALQA
jgi:tetratricopeptide (TPR) repeat protein